MHTFTEGTKAEAEKVNENFEEAKKGGGVVDLELADALSAGDVAYLNSSGKLAKALGKTIGSLNETGSTQYYFTGAERVDERKYLLFVYNSSASRLYGIVVTFTTAWVATFNTPVLLKIGSVDNFSSNYSPDDDRYVIAYTISGSLYTQIIEVSETTMTKTDSILISSGSGENILSSDTEYSSDENVFIFSWTDNNQTSSTVRCRAGELDLDELDQTDDTFTFGTQVNVSTNASYENKYLRSCYDSVNDVVHIVWPEKRSSSSVYFKNVTISISGTTLTANSVGTGTSDYGLGSGGNFDENNFDVCYNPDDEKVLLVYNNYYSSSSDWYRIKYLRGTPGATGITWENSSNYVRLTDTNTSDNYVRVTWDTASQTYIILYDDYDNGYLRVISATWNTTHEAGLVSDTELANKNMQPQGIGIISSSDGIVYFGAYYTGTYLRVITSGFTFVENRKDNLLFLMQESGDIGDTKQALAIESGGVSDVHSGLTVGAEQFAGVNGTLTETNNGFLVGVAISATKVYTPGRKLKYKEIDPVESTFSGSSSWQNWDLTTESDIFDGAKFLEVDVMSPNGSSYGIGVREYNSSVNRSVGSSPYNSATFTVSVESKNIIQIYNNNYSGVKFRVIGLWY